MKWLKDDLATLSGGSGSRAALILIAAHLAAVIPACLLWAFGLHPYFDEHHWIPATMAVIYAVVAVVCLYLRFGFWGTPATAGHGGGEKYMETFSPRTGFALGWLRWLLQLLLVAAILVPTVMTAADVRWWQLAGTDELDALPDRAASIPIPQSWTPLETETSTSGIAQIIQMNTSGGVEPEGYVEQTFAVPASFTVADLKTWVDSPDWADAGDDRAFGAIELERCVKDRQRCHARLVPPSGQEPEYFIRADLKEPSYDGDTAELVVRLTYRHYSQPDWDVSQETVDRAAEIPIPSDWTRYDVRATETQNGDQFSQYYSVPEEVTRDDLEDWLTGSAWTDPDSGEPFGTLDVDSPPCRMTGVDNDRLLCSAVVAGTLRSPEASDDEGPVESLTVSLTPDHTVRVSLERNG